LSVGGDTVARMAADPLPDIDFLDHLAHDSARFAAALRDAPSDARVPTCPDWDADDLIWHLADVQWFWGTIVREKVTTTEGADKLDHPSRPERRSELLAYYEQVSRDLAEVLAATPPDTAAWTWADEQTVGFIRRRQAHEALIHRVDAEVTAGQRTAMDTALCVDGVDEVLRVMYGGVPSWGTFTLDPTSTLRVSATDTGHSWLLTLGRFSGTDPDDGTVIEDEPDMRIADIDDGSHAAATISGPVADLDCWLWHRPPTASIERSGEAGVLEAFDAAIAPGIS
jgi:uncharacterized protein (TIGR03083 family)